MSNPTLANFGLKLPQGHVAHTSTPQVSAEVEKTIQSLLTTVKDEKKAWLFKSNMPSIRYIFRNGDCANFIGHRYFTINEKYAKELTEEIDNGHPELRIDPNEVMVLPSEQDPMVRFKNQVIADFLRDQALKTMDPTRDMGNSVQGKLNPTSTTDVSAVSGGGDARSIAARLADLGLKK